MPVRYQQIDSGMSTLCWQESEPMWAHAQAHSPAAESRVGFCVYWSNVIDMRHATRPATATDDGIVFSLYHLILFE
jgi:hypothetical protein